MKFGLKKLVIFALVMGLIMVMEPVDAAQQVFAQQYGFNEQGELKQPLTVLFKANQLTQIKATVKDLDDKNKLLLLAFPEGNSVFAANVIKGSEYALYKTELREPGSQELLILSYGKHGTGRTPLNGVDIIGMNELGKIVFLPVAGFKEVTLFNSPLQVKPNKILVLFRDKIQSVVNISWNKERKQFDVTGVE